MTLSDYMAEVKRLKFSTSKLAHLKYSENDKDCGYRSGLRYLGLIRSATTDAIAQFYIYGGSMPDARNASKSHPQMELFA